MSNLTESREFFFRKSSEYNYPNSSLLKVLEIKKPKDIKWIKLYINGKEIQCTDANKHGIVSWNFEKIREEYRDVLGMTPEENTKLCLETLFEMCNIRGRDHYLTLDSKYIDTAIFTAEFEMFGIVLFNQFGKPIDPENGPEKIEAKEIVYVSDVHKESYGDRLGKEHESKFFK